LIRKSTVQLNVPGVAPAWIVSVKFAVSPLLTTCDGGVNVRVTASPHV